MDLKQNEIISILDRFISWVIIFWNCLERPKGSERNLNTFYLHFLLFLSNTSLLQVQGKHWRSIRYVWWDIKLRTGCFLGNGNKINYKLFTSYIYVVAYIRCRLKRISNLLMSIWSVLWIVMCDNYLKIFDKMKRFIEHLS